MKSRKRLPGKCLHPRRGRLRARRCLHPRRGCLHPRRGVGVLLFLLFCLSLQIPAFSVPSVRIKDIAYFKGIRENQLMGIGLVTGLSGKGDSSGSQLLKIALANLVANFGFSIEPKDIKSKNSAVVMISSEVPPFLRAGDRIDVRVSSIGDARSLEGGVLLQTPLKGANGRVYALAQGQISTQGANGSLKTVGIISVGAIVEQDILSQFITDGSIAVVLRNPDFVTVGAVAQVIKETFEDITLRTVDASLVEVEIPENRLDDPISFMAELESLTLTPDASGKVVIDSSSGIIIFGEKVRIGKVAVSYKAINLTVGAFRTGFAAEEEKKRNFVIEEIATVEDLVNTLQTIGLDTETIIGLMKAIDRAGSLYGKLIIM